jgi:signal transduction histidine kinase
MQSSPRAHHYFSVRRRTLALLLLGTVLLPAALFGAWSWLSLRSAMAEAEEQAALLARVVQEQASKVLESNRLANSRICDLTHGVGNAELHRREREFHRRMAQIADGLPQALALSVFDASGALVVSSRYYPVPPVDISKREDFRAVVAEGNTPHVSALVKGSISPEMTFKDSMQRRSATDELLGMVSVSLRPAYFAEFYQDVLVKAGGFTAALVRRDGAVLSAYPPVPPTGLPPELLAELEHAPATGAERMLRTAGLDGRNSIVTLRPIAGGRLYAVIGVPLAAIRAEWRHQMLTAALIAAIPCVALWLLGWQSLRRLREEEAAYLSWQRERSRREDLEKRYRQSRKLEAVGRLMASVAHDFRNVLSIISAHTDVLLLRSGVPVDRAVAGIRKGVASGSALAGRLLGLATKREHLRERICLRDELLECEPLIRAALGPRVALRCRVEPDCRDILADKCELELALVNLAANARDAMPEGGIFELTAANVAAADRQSPEFPEGLEGRLVCLNARDNGIGMPPEVARRALEALYTTKPGTCGTGLGLTQVSDFCQEAGGAASIDSELGVGTTVRLYLPAADSRRLPREVAVPD